MNLRVICVKCSTRPHLNGREGLLSLVGLEADLPAYFKADGDAHGRRFVVFQTNQEDETPKSPIRIKSAHSEWVFELLTEGE